MVIGLSTFILGGVAMVLREVNILRMSKRGASPADLA
jgi:hypothetical protein